MSETELHFKISPVSPDIIIDIGLCCFISYSEMDCLQFPQGAAGLFTTKFLEVALMAMALMPIPGNFAEA